MYGLEKEKIKKFDFDLEVEIRKNPSRKKEIISNAKSKANEIRNELKAKQRPANFEDLAHLLNGYDALEKVINKIK